jgi:hypothetical protein
MVAASDKQIAMATYSYILCTNCAGSGKANGNECKQCLGARMTGAVVDEHLYRILEIAACDFLPTNASGPLAYAQLE